MTLQLFINGELVVEDFVTEDSVRLRSVMLANYSRKFTGNWELILTGVLSKGNHRPRNMDFEGDLEDFIKKEKKLLYGKKTTAAGSRFCYPVAFEL